MYYIYTNTDFFGKDINVNIGLIAICYAKNNLEVYNLCIALKELGYINLDFWGQSIAKCTLKTREYAYINEKIEENSLNKQCFVAMWFDKTYMDEITPFISRAITDTGFEPFISVGKEHNDDICDYIVAGIKNSRFVIADFTGQRPSVYFEAGLALGLGIPVIWTCRYDWFHNEAIIKKEVKMIIAK